MTKLNEDQLNQLKKKFCLALTEDMELETLYEIVFDQLMDGYEDYNQEEIKEEIISYCCGAEEYYEDWVNEINPYTNTNPEAVTDYGVGK